MSLKQFIGEYNLDFFLKKQKFDPPRSGDDPKGIGIIFSADSLHHQQLALKFQERLQLKTREHIYIFGYVPRRLESHVTFAFPHFSRSDFGIKPDFSRHKIALFMQRQYRVCMNLDLDNHRIVHYVVANTHASYKMGISPEYPALYNIIVTRDEQDELEFLLDKTLDIFEKTVAL